MIGAIGMVDPKLPEYLYEFIDVFSEEKAGILADYILHDHAIETEPGKMLL